MVYFVHFHSIVNVVMQTSKKDIPEQNQLYQDWIIFTKNSANLTAQAHTEIRNQKKSS